ncbi:MAG: plasmid maintenance system antidote protein [Bacteroidetes bacterium]|nr:plasmid maintenance system antidote protein [Bacteroidota bacterium]
MKLELKRFKGLHPGIVLDRKLAERKLSKGKFAISIQEYPQTIGAITKGKRAMNTKLALKIEDKLGLEEGFFMFLQIYFEINELKKVTKQNNVPDLKGVRPALFWDTDVNKIDWHKQKRAVISRVLERGNSFENRVFRSFYGRQVFDEIASQNKRRHDGQLILEHDK